MTEYKNLIENARKLLAAEEWGEKLKMLQVHKLNSMWYEPEPNVAKDQSVVDKEYNSGKITRDGVVIRQGLTGQELVNEWSKTNEL